MAVKFGPNGEITTVFREQQERLEAERQRRVEETGQRLLSDGMKWQELVRRVGKKKAEKLIEGY